MIKNVSVTQFAFGIVFIVFAWSAINPQIYWVWFYEIIFVIIGAPILFLTRKKFPLTTTAYLMISVLFIVELIGGHYTYKNVPIGEWVAEVFDIHRNHFDRVAHFMMGVVPAIVIREIAIRYGAVKKGIWLFLFATFFSLACAAFYELFQWLTAEAMGIEPSRFLEAQGDYWDSQNDMFIAFLGALISQMLLNKTQNRQIKNIARQFDTSKFGQEQSCV